MRKDELERFKKKLQERRDLLLGDLDRMAEEALKKSREDTSGDFNDMADMGSDNFEQDFTISLMEKEQEELREIEEAMERLEDGTYGTCEECRKRIGIERLRALPHAKLCIECKTAEEKNGPSWA